MARRPLPKKKATAAKRPAAHRAPNAAKPVKSAKPANDAVLRDELEAFVMNEAELLDQGRFEEWLALFAPKGIYWMPGVPGQEDPLNTVSIFYEDRDILEIRVRRMRHPANVAQSPFPRTSHVVGSIRIEKANGKTYEVSSRQQIVEYREGDGQRVFGGRCRHRLTRVGGKLKIAEKRFDLVNCDAPHTFITLPL